MHKPVREGVVDFFGVDDPRPHALCLAQVHERLNRRYVQDGDNHDIEVNIFGKASRQHESLIILGESKAQLSKNDIDRFMRKKFDRLKKRFPNMFPVLITYMTSESDVEAYAKRQGIALYYSYDFEQEVV